MNSKLHAVCDGHGRPLILILSEGQISDYKGAARMLHAFPKAKSLLADKGPRTEETFRRHAFWAVNEHIDGRRARMDNLPTHTQAQTPRLDESMMENMLKFSLGVKTTSASRGRPDKVLVVLE
ncbi:hypothetical protein ATO67_09225 [Agrobacterium bohemicum]|uniref:Transposase IS4-like domain-containing protein n=1 Tax=Agrobacterium bohemicum TaxID=2052828 RepID=A0A135P0A5_9HYPH|nr:transposase [Agrobacterium bohemicum]KXG84816.1 hypothetical protein ATO67_09225 [Agrobacterium bohemicum]